MNTNRLSPRVIVGILLLVFFGVSLIIRIVLPYGQVFEGQMVVYTSVDGYYYMRLVDSMVHNFPQYLSFDPFHIFPGGQTIEHLGFFYQVLAGIIWLFGLGSPSQSFIDAFGTLFPPILAALTIIPVYFIGKTLFNRWVGVIAAVLMAVFPGEYLGRSLLGFTDTPVVETFFTATAMAFLVLAIKSASERQLTVSHLLKLERGIFLRPVIYSLLAGVFLGTYMATWNGGLLFVFIITLYLVVQFIIDHLRGPSSPERTEYLGIVGFVLFLITGIFFLPVSEERFISAAVVIAIIIPVAMAAASRFMSSRGLKPAYYPLAILGLAVVIGGITFAISSRTMELMVGAFRIFAPVGSTAVTTMEMQPFLAPTGSFSTAVAWGNFTTSFFLFPGWAIPGIGLIAYLVLTWVITKQPTNSPQRLQLRAASVVMLALGILLLLIYFSLTSSVVILVFAAIILILFFIVFIWLFSRPGNNRNAIVIFFIWTLIILSLTLVQRRFAYYLVVNMALLTAYLSWEIIWRFSLKKLAEKPEVVPEEAKSKKRRRRRTGPSVGGYRVITGAVAVVLLVVVIPWNIIKSVEIASAPAFLPSAAWQESLTWMKDNTPEPLGAPDDYYQLYKSDFEYPASAYGVTSWWDYGYWITRIGHRIPSANPSQEPDPILKVASLFLSHDASQAGNILGELQTKYIVGDHATATSKFWAIVTWAGEPQENYLPAYFVQQGDAIQQAQVYTPEYYQTLYIRLYNFNGQEVTKARPIVVAFTERETSDGVPYRLVTESRQFDSYPAALAYVEEAGAETHAVVGSNPFISPVPLEAVPDFSLVFESTKKISVPEAGSKPEVKIFEYTRP